MKVLKSPLLRDLFERAGHQAFGKVRPWKEFFNGLKMSLLRDKRLMQRVLTNLLYFSGNYIITLVIITIVHMVLDPFLALCYIIIFSIWGYMYYLYIQGVMINGVKVEYYIFISISLFIGLMILSISKRLLSTIWCFLCAIMIILVHASIRKRSLRSKLVMKTTHFPFNLDQFFGTDIERIPLVTSSVGEYKPDKQGLNNRSNGAVLIEAGNAPAYEDSESD